MAQRQPVNALSSRRPVHLLLDRNFGPWFLGNLFSNTGTWFQLVAQSLLVYRLTGSVFLVGVINFTQFAGILLLASWAGAAADRFERRRLLLTVQSIATGITALLAILAFAGLATVPLVVGMALLLSCCTAFSVPSNKAIIPRLVERGDIRGAVMMDSIAFNLSRVSGPILGVIVVARLGIPWAFALNSLSFGAMLVALLLIRPGPQQRSRGRVLLRDSLRMVLRDRRLLVLLGATAAIAISADPVNTLSPAFATRVFHRPDTLTGYLVGAFGAGAVLAALVAGRASRTPYRRLAVLLLCMAAGISTFALSGPLVLGLGAFVLAGYAYLAGETQATTLLQLGVEDSERGRIMALWSLAYLGIRPLTSLADGAFAQAASIHAAALVMALPSLCGAVLLAFWVRRTAATPATPERPSTVVVQVADS